MARNIDWLNKLGEIDRQKQIDRYDGMLMKNNKWHMKLLVMGKYLKFVLPIIRMHVYVHHTHVDTMKKNQTFCSVIGDKHWKYTEKK